MEIGSREAIREAVIRGLGISYVSEAEFVPRSFASSDPDRGMRKSTPTRMSLFCRSGKQAGSSALFSMLGMQNENMRLPARGFRGMTGGKKRGRAAGGRGTSLVLRGEGENQDEPAFSIPVSTLRRGIFTTTLMASSTRSRA